MSKKQRIAALEAKVADLEARVAALPMWSYPAPHEWRTPSYVGDPSPNLTPQITYGTGTYGDPSAYGGKQ